MSRFCEFREENGKRCGIRNRSHKDRFCPPHEAAMRRRMISDGYLQRLTTDPAERGKSAREDVKATKFGTDG